MYILTMENWSYSRISPGRTAKDDKGRGKIIVSKGDGASQLTAEFAVRVLYRVIQEMSGSGFLFLCSHHAEITIARWLVGGLQSFVFSIKH